MLLRKAESREALKDAVAEMYSYRKRHEAEREIDGYMPHSVHFVNLYDIGQGYGGPEEGGWWFDTGEPLASIPVRTEGDARRAAAMIADAYGVGHEEWADVRPYYSAAGGTDYNVCVETRTAQAYPTERPHYE